jgi:hypothetical protein
MFVDNLKVDVIATYENHEQDHFKLLCVRESAIKSEKKLIDYIKEQLINAERKEKDLVKLSLCWECSKEIVDKYKTIQKSISKNGKYFFN